MKKELGNYYDEFFGTGYWEMQYKPHIMAFAETFIKKYIKSAKKLTSPCCPNCGSEEIVEFLNRNKRQCQICEHLWQTI